MKTGKKIPGKKTGKIKSTFEENYGEEGLAQPDDISEEEPVLQDEDFPINEADFEDEEDDGLV